MVRLCLALLLLLAGSVSAHADLDDEVSQPYRLRLALRVAPHRLLTPYFKTQLERELRDSLQSGFGALVDVEVIDLNNPKVLALEPLLQRVASKGLQQGLEGQQEMGPHKTHFIFIDYLDGQYQIEARQHDGSTGLASATVRNLRTPDRQLVARAAALLVNQDFGLVGTVKKVESNRVELAIKGGERGVPLHTWLKKDEVFAIVAVARSRGGLVSDRLPWALVRATQEANGSKCACLIFNRLEYRGGQVLPTIPGLLGFRCLKLGTAEASPRLRFIDERTRAPMQGLQVLASAHGFDDKAPEEGSTLANGLVELKAAYKHMAFVQVKSGGEPVARIPVEILGDRIIACPISVAPDGERLGQLNVRRRRWLKHIGEQLLEEGGLVKRLNELGANARDKAIQQAREGLDNLGKGIESLREEQQTLREAAGKSPLDLKEGEEGLQELQKRRERLAAYIKGLEEIDKLENDPKRKEWKAAILRAGKHEEAAEFEEAIQLYDRVLKEGSDDANVKKRLADLRRDWELKGDDHRKARSYLYQTWPKPKDPQQLKNELAEARKAFQACEKYGDRLTPQKLLKANIDHAVKLQKDGESLRPDDDDDQRVLKLIAELTPDLSSLSEDVINYLKSTR